MLSVASSAHVGKLALLALLATALSLVLEADWLALGGAAR